MLERHRCSVWPLTAVERYAGVTPSRDESRTMDPKAQVRESYNRIAAEYLLSRRRDSPDVALLDDFVARLPPRARVLDAGCGAGVPIAQQLAACADVVGVDFAETQLNLARRHVPAGHWVCADLVVLPSLMRPSTRCARTTPLFTSRENNMPEYSMASCVCCGREGWPFSALARRICQPGQSSIMTSQCTGATSTPRRVFRWWRLPASSWCGIVGSRKDPAGTCSCWPSDTTLSCGW